MIHQSASLVLELYRGGFSISDSLNLFLYTILLRLSSL
nr:MAG TPA: hypothetical protein [Caudoviricetes sp.]DAT72301.1 MAG TPA: hypothetical protein [Caudoviricetes sp.]